MKKTLFTVIVTAALTLSVSPTARAYTIDEILAGGNVAQEVLTTSLNLGCYPDLSYTTTFEKVSDTQVKLKNFGNFGTDFILTLCNNNLVATNNGTKLKIDYQSTTSTSRTLLPGLLQGFYSSGKAAYNFNDEPSWHLTIGETEEGNIYLTADNVVAYRIGSETPVDARIFHKVEYVFYQPNCVASHTRTTYRPRTNYFGEIIGVTKGTPYMEDFQARVEINEAEGTFRIMNFTNYGMAEDRDNVRRCITGTLNPENHTIKFDEEQAALKLLYIDPNTYPYYGYWLEYQLPYCLKSTDADVEYFYPELTGTYFCSEFAHNNATNAWVTNLGKRRTLSGFKLTVDQDYSYTYFDNMIPGFNAGFVPDNLNFHDVYSDAVYDGSTDLTLDVKLNLDKVGVDDQNILVTGSIVTNKNDMYVDHYELYAVPGHYSTINDAGFTHDLEHGHTAALNIHDAKYSYHEDEFNAEPAARVAKLNTDGSAVGTHDYKFSRLIPRSDIASHPANHYTFFIKAVYKDDKPQLTPTFHDLQYRDINTGVEDLVAEAAATVEAGHGVITIGGTDAAAVVYNASGATVYSGTDRTISVAAGLYIVKVGRTVAKVVVR